MTKARVDNDLYRRLGREWWNEDVGEFSTIRFFVNPVRFGYFRRVLENRGRLAETGLTLLDVGCGGGLLAEEFARIGFRVTGIDPAPESIEAAREHAAQSGLGIDYRVGCGERLPFADASFDFAACCDVLEHVEDVDAVIGEIARVLDTEGLFFFDTVNRTFMSKLAVIKVAQEWRATAFCVPNGHVWEKFVKPAELTAALARHGLTCPGMRGISIKRHPVAILLNMHRQVKGRISFKELGRRLRFYESDDLRVSYMGYAEKPGGAGQ